MNNLQSKRLLFFLIIGVILIIIIVTLLNFWLLQNRKILKNTGKETSSQNWTLPNHEISLGTFQNGGAEFSYYNQTTQQLTIFSTAKNKIIWTSGPLSKIIDVIWSPYEKEAFVAYLQENPETPGQNLPSYLLSIQKANLPLVSQH